MKGGDRKILGLILYMNLYINYNDIFRALGIH